MQRITTKWRWLNSRIINIFTIIINIPNISDFDYDTGHTALEIHQRIPWVAERSAVAEAGT